MTTSASAPRTIVRSAIYCQLDRDLRPRHTRTIDGLHWPQCYAAATLAGYRRRYGLAAILYPGVAEHIAMFRGWDPS
jgi:hypothetical protein